MTNLEYRIYLLKDIFKNDRREKDAEKYILSVKIRFKDYKDEDFYRRFSYDEHITEYVKKTFPSLFD